MISVGLFEITTQTISEFCQSMIQNCGGLPNWEKHNGRYAMDYFCLQENRRRWWDTESQMDAAVVKREKVVVVFEKTTRVII